MHQLYSGKLKIKLKGKKLKGEFALVKAYGRGENGWLLMKLGDRYATKDEVTLQDKSVISKKTNAQMEQAPDKVYGENIVKVDSTVKDQKDAGKKAVDLVDSQLNAEAPKEKTAVRKASNLLKNAPEQPFYHEVEPMLATLVDQPFDSDEWLYEIKWDGYRAVAFTGGKRVDLKSRNNKSFSEKFYPIQQEL